MIERASATLAREQERPYTTLMNSAVEAITQPDALAIYVYLQTKAERWIVRRADVMSRFGFGKDRYHKAMKHLREVGLVSNTQIRDKDSGTILDTQIVIHYEPKSVATEVRSNQSPAEPDSGKQGHLTIDQSLEIKQDNNNGGTAIAESSQHVIDIYHETIERLTPNWAKSKSLTDKRKKIAIKAIHTVRPRATELGYSPLEYLDALLKAMAQDPFYSGTQPSRDKPNGYQWTIDQVLRADILAQAIDRLSGD